MWLRLVPQFRANVPDWNCSCAGTDSLDTNWLLLTDSSIRHSYKDSLNPELDSNRKGSLSTGQWDIVPCIWVHPSPCPCPLALNTAETIRYSSTAPVFYMCVIPVTFHLLGEVMLSSGPCLLSILQSWMIAWLHSWSPTPWRKKTKKTPGKTWNKFYCLKALWPNCHPSLEALVPDISKCYAANLPFPTSLLSSRMDII